MPLRSLKRPFFARSVHEVAPELIGATLLIDDVGGRIVEVEAYHHTDPAAHSFRGMTDRNAVMFGPPGYAYVYRSYVYHDSSGRRCDWRRHKQSRFQNSAVAIRD